MTVWLVLPNAFVAVIVTTNAPPESDAAVRIPAVRRTDGVRGFAQCAVINRIRRSIRRRETAVRQDRVHAPSPEMAAATIPGATNGTATAPTITTGRRIRGKRFIVIHLSLISRRLTESY